MDEKEKMTNGTGSVTVNNHITVAIPLRDLFAAFALAAVVGLNLEDATREIDAAYAYNAADAMLKVRAVDAALSARGTDE
jgi:hypothetical protein